jgi:hypothetical protein
VTSKEEEERMRRAIAKALLGLTAASLILTQGWQVVTPGSNASAEESTKPPTSELTGQALVDALDLQPTSTHPDGSCYGNSVELHENEAYCLPADRFPSPVERWRLSMQIRGSVPTNAEAKAYEAQLALVEATNGNGDPDEISQLTKQYHKAVEASTAPADGS